MIKFFRNIRQNLLNEDERNKVLQEQNQSTALVESTAKRVGKTSRYLKYAIGEIVLVVIGILIALSINNWNEERKENIHQRSVLANLLQDLKSDSISYSLNLQGLKDTNFSYDQLYKTGVKNDTTIVISDPNIVRFLINYNPITKENDPFIATKITNDITRKEILIYFRDMTDMDDIYSELDDIMKTKMRTYLGSKKMYKLSSWFENKSSSTTYDVAGPDFIDATELIALSKEPEFQQILFEVSLKIVNTIDILEILIKQNANLIRLIENELNKQ